MHLRFPGYQRRPSNATVSDFCLEVHGSLNSELMSGAAETAGKRLRNGQKFSSVFVIGELPHTAKQVSTAALTSQHL
jgi:hypothetical protein